MPLHRVQYVVRSRHIHPVSIAGNMRVFSDAQVATIAGELQRIRQVRSGSNDCRTDEDLEARLAEGVTDV